MWCYSFKVSLITYKTVSRVRKWNYFCTQRKLLEKKNNRCHPFVKWENQMVEMCLGLPVPFRDWSLGVIDFCVSFSLSQLKVTLAEPSGVSFGPIVFVALPFRFTLPQQMSRFSDWSRGWKKVQVSEATGADLSLPFTFSSYDVNNLEKGMS